MKKLAKLIDDGMRMLDQERLVRASGYFDAEWYARTYNDVGSPRAQAADATLDMQAGPELSVAATKTFVTSAAACVWQSSTLCCSCACSTARRRASSHPGD